MKKVAKVPLNPTSVAVVALMTLALSLLATDLPNFITAHRSTEPSLVFLLITGFVVIVGMSVVLLIAMKLGLGLSRSTLFAVLAFNVALIIIKFILSPLGLYMTDNQSPFNGQPFLVGISNSASGFWFAAGGSLLAYLLSLWIIFKIASHGMNIEHSKLHYRLHPWLLFVAAIVVVAIFAGQIVNPLMLAFLPVAGLQDYLSKLGVMLPVIGVLLFVAIMFAMSAFKSAAADAESVRKPALLAGLFWFCLCLILMYHILWVVFMTALVTIWPFKTFIPNSK